MSQVEPSIVVPVDLTNPGQFFACCGLLELADRLWPEAEAGFQADRFFVAAPGTLCDLIHTLRHATVRNTMTEAQDRRLAELASIPKKQREAQDLEAEKKQLEALRREEPIVFGPPISLRVDWFRDEYCGGSRFKTWAGQQCVLDMVAAMHAGLRHVGPDASSVWASAAGVGLPFNFDSDLGGQGAALDVGFSFDALATSGTTRIEGTCRPGLELLAFIGLQRCRPRDVGDGRFVYAPWKSPLPASVAAAVVCQAIAADVLGPLEFRLLYRNKYYKSFLPAVPYQGEDDE